MLAQLLDPAAQGGQPAPEGRKDRCMHLTSIYTCHSLDNQDKIQSMKNNLLSLQRRYEGLRKTLAVVGYLSQGSVLDRSRLKTPRSGYQWTCKVSRKTITVALS